MAQIRITLTAADYARLMPLATGEVKPHGIDLTLRLSRRGSWPERAEMLRRAVQDPAVQGGEWSMAQYLYRIDKGDHRFVGLPVFPLRNFTARDLYVRRGGPIRDARRPGGQAHRHVQLLGERLHLVPPLPALHRPRSRRHPVVDRRRRRRVVLARRSEPAGRREDRAVRPLTVRHAAGRRAGGRVQPAAAAGLPSPVRAHRAPVPGLSPDRGRTTSAAPGRSRPST